MANIKLFSVKDGIKELESKTVTLEKNLQKIIEDNMETFFGVTFLKSEYVTTNGGRMDSIGIDENYCPVIFEYKRNQDENIINQGLFYLDWLVNNKDSFKVLVIEKLGIEKLGIKKFNEIFDKIDWTAPRIICIAHDFSKYDKSAINQMTRNISLIRYEYFNNEYLMFEQVNENISKRVEGIEKNHKSSNSQNTTFEENYNNISDELKNLYAELQDYILGHGDDVSEHRLKFHSAFKKIKNIICVTISKNQLYLYLKLDADTVEYEDGFSENVTKKGHLGTGNVKIILKNKEDLNKAKDLITRAYNEN